MAVRPRLLVASLGVAVLVSIVGGYLVSRSDDGDGGADDSVELDASADPQDATIGTNASVEGATLPLVDLETNGGEVLSTADLLGQPLIVNVWFSTCGPCKRELPEFAAVQTELGDRIRFVGVNPYDTPGTNESFARERGVGYELLRDPGSTFVDAVGISAFPVTLFVAADGTIVRQTGVLDEADLRTYAEELLT